MLKEKFPDASKASNVSSSHCYPGCTLGDADSYKLIGCDGIDCTTEWFHIECVALTTDTIPNVENWLCPVCIHKDSIESVTPKDTYTAALELKLVAQTLELQARKKSAARVTTG